MTPLFRDSLLANQDRTLSGNDAGLEAAPQFLGQQAEKDDEHLAADEEDQPFERGIREAIAVQADAQHIHAEPGEAGHNVAEDGEVH